MAVSVSAAGCGEAFEPHEDHEDDREFDTRAFRVMQTIPQIQSSIARGEFCQISVQDYGTVDLEENYLPQVVQCENGQADLEALKAQAITARSFALYKIYNEQVGTIAADTSAQAYDCGAPVTDKVRQAVRETQGQVLTYRDYVVAAFYKAGAQRASTDAQCRANGGPFARTEREITHNEGHSGASIHQTPIGLIDPSNYANRGAMGQNEAACLERNQGYDANQILEYFYGADIQVTQLQAPCFDASSSTNPVTGPIADDTDSQPQCQSTTSRPDIITRAEWGARAPTGVRARQTPRRIMIHHTTGATGSSGNGAALVRSAQSDHLDGRGWSDIGYHYLISADGKIYEGSAPVTRQGAHTLGENDDSVGIALLGNFENVQPSDAQLRSTGRMIAWLSDSYDIDVNYNASNPSSGTLSGHGHHNNTDCPGRHLAAELPELVDIATSQTVCEPGDAQTDNPADDPERNLETPDLTTDDLDFKFVRIEAISDDPAGDNDDIDGFELDAVVVTQDGDQFTASQVVSGSAQNASAALGAPDNDSCDNRASTVAALPTGSAVVLEMEQTFGANDTLSIAQANYNVGLSDCTPSGTVRISVSHDGSTWAPISDSSSGNGQFTIEGPRLDFIEPTNHGTYPAQMEMAVDADPRIVEVRYFAETYALKTSRDADANFRISYDFNGLGRRILTAKGFDAQGDFVAFDQLEVTVTDQGLGFVDLDADGAYPTTLAWHLAVTDDQIVEVTCTSDGYPVGQPAVASEGWKVSHDFTNPGNRNIRCEGRDNSGAVVDTVDVDIIVTDDAPGLEFLAPKDRGWYKRSGGIEFRVRSHDNRIERIEYVADEQWKFGDSADPSDDYAYRHDFSHYGSRRITAVGYDANGDRVAQSDIYIYITDDDGKIPEGSPNVINTAPPNTTPADAGSVDEQPQSYDQMTRQSLAQRVLQYHREGKVLLNDGHPSGVVDNAHPLANITDAAAGRKAQNSCYSNAPCGSAWLDKSMLTSILRIYDDLDIVPTISSIAGASHSRGSTHYYGKAVDISQYSGANHHRVCGPPVTTVATMIRNMSPAPSLLLNHCNEPTYHWHHTHANW